MTQPNQGAAAARNAALKASRGDYIQWLDADDLLAPEKIARQIAALGPDADPRVLLSAEWGRFMYRPDRAEFTPTALWSELSPADWLRLKLGNNLYMQTATWLVSRELTEAAGPWNTALLGDDDGEYFCRVLLGSQSVRFVPGARVFYRLAGADTLSNIGQSDRKMEAHVHSMRLHIGYLRLLEDSERVHAACVQDPANLADSRLSRASGHRAADAGPGRAARRTFDAAAVVVEVLAARGGVRDPAGQTLAGKAA